MESLDNANEMGVLEKHVSNVISMVIQGKSILKGKCLKNKENPPTVHGFEKLPFKCQVG